MSGARSRMTAPAWMTAADVELIANSRIEPVDNDDAW